MDDNTAPAIVAASLSLARSHGHAPALDVLDLVMKGCQGQALDFAGQAHPGAPFGQLLAAAFDQAMCPDDWKLWTTPQADPKLIEACLMIWRVYVLPRFESRYGVTVSGVNHITVDEARCHRPASRPGHTVAGRTAQDAASGHQVLVSVGVCVP